MQRLIEKFGVKKVQHRIFDDKGRSHIVKEEEMPKYSNDKECCYEEMSNEGKDGGQSITKIDNSIHSQYWNEPYVNNYENTRKSFMGDKGFDWSGMEKGKR